MKLVLPLLLLPILCTGCNAAPSSDELTRQLIREQIVAYHHNLRVEGYKPLSFSPIDTVSLTRNRDGSAFSITGVVRHTYRSGRSGESKQHSSVFDVQLYRDGVVVLAQENQPKQAQRPTILL